MAKDSKIEWTDHTFNPWWGCWRIAAECEHCYAEVLADRFYPNLWGRNAQRKFASEATWAEPLKWNRAAASAGVAARVFTMSMGDLFEVHPDSEVNHRMSVAWGRLWQLIAETPSLIWLLLTKRPEEVSDLVPWGSKWPENVWLGATAGCTRSVERVVPALLRNPASVHFVSAEPLLQEISLARYLVGPTRIDWVLIGGESGQKARPMQPAWARALRDECLAAGVAVHFKQWGQFGPQPGSDQLISLGKKKSGRLLDGRTWDEMPAAWAGRNARTGGTP